MAENIRILAIGDVVSPYGCDKLRECLPNLKKEKKIDVCIVNGENAAAGNGILPSAATHILDSGADLITGGNHTYRRREIYELLDASPDIIRPANYGEGCPGKGVAVIDKGAFRVGVINLLGTTFMEPLENPFSCADRLLCALEKEVKIIVVDFHAEATAEKRALGFYLDGRVSAVFGTHTHVQTADEQIFPGKTGYITDVGMTGPRHSVLGVEPQLAIEKFKTNMPVRFKNPEGDCILQGVLFTVCKADGRTVSVERISI